MSRLLHSLTHRHVLAAKPDVGMFMGCTPRLHGRTQWSFAYAEGDQPDWLPVTTSTLARITHLRHMQAAGFSTTTLTERRKTLSRLDVQMPHGIDRATSDEIAGWLGKYNGWSLYTYFEAAYAFYAWASRGRQPYLDFNPMIELTRPRCPKNMPRPVTRDQAAAALALPAPWGLIATLAYYNGLRCAEICTVDRERVTRDDLEIVRKGGKRASLPTHTAVWEAIRSLPAGPVVRTPGRGWRFKANNLSFRFSREMTAAGMPDVTLHRFRHAYATQSLLPEELGGGGQDIRVIQELLGHANLSSTQIYTQITDRQRRLAVQALPTLTTPSQDAA